MAVVHGLTCTCHPRTIRRVTLRSAVRPDTETGVYTGGARWAVPLDHDEQEALDRSRAHLRATIKDLNLYEGPDTLTHEQRTVLGRAGLLPTTTTEV